MNKDYKRVITIETQNEDDKHALADHIVKQLINKADWKLGNIGVHVSEPCVVKIIIHKDCINMPNISIC